MAESIEFFVDTQLEVHSGSGHNGPMKFDDFTSAYRYAKVASEGVSYINSNSKKTATLVRREVRETVWRFKGGDIDQ